MIGSDFVSAGAGVYLAKDGSDGLVSGAACRATVVAAGSGGASRCLGAGAAARKARVACCVTSAVGTAGLFI